MSRASTAAAWASGFFTGLVCGSVGLIYVIEKGIFQETRRIVREHNRRQRLARLAARKAALTSWRPPIPAPTRGARKPSTSSSESPSTA